VGWSQAQEEVAFSKIKLVVRWVIKWLKPVALDIMAVNSTCLRAVPRTIYDPNILGPVFNYSICWATCSICWATCSICWATCSLCWATCSATCSLCWATCSLCWATGINSLMKQKDLIEGHTAEAASCWPPREWTRTAILSTIHSTHAQVCTLHIEANSCPLLPQDTLSTGLGCSLRSES